MVPLASLETLHLGPLVRYMTKRICRIHQILHFILSKHFATLPWTCQTGGPRSHENSSLHNLFSPVSSQLDRSPHGIASSGPQKLSSPIRIEPTRQYNNQAAISELGGSLGQGNFGHGMQMFHPHSLPESHNGICNISKSMTSSGRSAGFRVDGVDYGHLQKVGSGSLHGHSFDQNNEGKTHHG